MDHSGLFANLIRQAILALVQLYYPRITIVGRERLPRGKPLIFVLNHPNGLIDALVLMRGLKRIVTFLAKSTFFAHAPGRLAMQAFTALPVYRQRDVGKVGGSASPAPERNAATFARCHALLQQGGALALFPEGTSHTEAVLQPLRTGAARIALSAASTAPQWPELYIVPVGIWYEQKARFRSAVLLLIGAPFGISELVPAYRNDPQQAVLTLTEQIAVALRATIVQEPDAKLLQLFNDLAVWTSLADANLAMRYHSTVARLAAYHQCQTSDPARARALLRLARRYRRGLRRLQISDPWPLEDPALQWRIAQLSLLLLLGLLPALAGLALSYGPARLAAPLAVRLIGKSDEMTITGKLIIGTLLLGATWLLAALLTGALAGVGWGITLLLLAPLLAAIGMHWMAGAQRLLMLKRAAWLRWRHPGSVSKMVAWRHELGQVADALGTVSLDLGQL